MITIFSIQNMAAKGVKAVLATSFIALSINTAIAQKVAPPPKDIVYTAVEHSASFKGGMPKFYDFLKSNLHYPALAKTNKVSGRVILTFVVGKDGSLSDIKVKKGIGSGCDEEAIRVFKASPKWNPGTQDGKAVKQQFTLPVNFGLVASAGMAKATAPAPKMKVDDDVDKAAEFPGGMKEFYAYAAKTIKYPESARKNNVQGKVFISFIVEEDGSLTDMQVMKGIGSGCDEEAIKALANGPKWIPGQQNGVPVSSHYTIPIGFTLTK